MYKDLCSSLYHSIMFLMLKPKQNKKLKEQLPTGNKHSNDGEMVKNTVVHLSECGLFWSY